MGRAKGNQAAGAGAANARGDKKGDHRTPQHYNCYVQVLGTGMDTGDTGPSVLLFFDNKRFLFNVGEGFQRYCIEHKVRLSKLNHLFFSRVSSETFGGLPGLLLTLHSVTGAPLGMGLYGPPPLDQLVDAMGAFCPVRALGCQTYCFKRDGSLGRATTSSGGFGPVDFRRDPSGAESANAGVAFQPPTPAGGSGSGPGGAKEVYRDDFVTISSVVLAPGNEVLASMGENSAEARAGEDDFLESNPKRFRLDGRGSASPSPSPRTPPPESTTPRGGDDAKLSVVYICELPDVPGKFDPGKARARGLPPGKDYARLVQGETVTAPNGQVIKPSDVMGPTTPGPVFVLADCPTPAHLGALVGAQGLARFQAGAERGKQANVVIHLTPPAIVELPEYQRWVASLGGAKHVVAGYGHHGLGRPVYISSMRLTAKLNCIAPEVFPLHMPAEQQAAAREAGEAAEEVAAHLMKSAGAADLVPGQNLLKFTLRPVAQQGLDESLVTADLDVQQVQNDVIAATPEAILAARDVSGIAGPDPRLLTLAEDAIREGAGAGPSGNGPEVGGNGSMKADDSTDAWRVRGLTVDDGAANAGRVSDAGVSDAGLRELDQDLRVSEQGLGVSDAGLVVSDAGLGVSDAGAPQAVPECLQGVGREEMELAFLGTGSSQPSKYRNVSAIYVHRFARGGFLMDCGEGTYGQLKRRYGAKLGDTVVAHLHLVWISHIHADHHAGLVRILAARKAARKALDLPAQPLVVVAPRLLRRFLTAYDNVEKMDMVFVDCVQTVGYGARGSLPGRTGLQPFTGIGTDLDTGFREKAALREAMSRLGLTSLVSVGVIHCPQSYGVVIETEGTETRPGMKLAYSGDTRPCPAFVEASKGATVFIHEATFDNELEDEALAKRHSTTREAVTAGAAAGAFRTILTHFSQRYPKMPVVDESFTDRTCVAFDMMSVNVADLVVVPKLMSVLKLLFPEAEEPEEGGEEELGG